MPRNSEFLSSGQAARRSAAMSAMATRAFWITSRRGSIALWLETQAFRQRYAATMIMAINAELMTTSINVKPARRSADL